MLMFVFLLLLLPYEPFLIDWLPADKRELLVRRRPKVVVQSSPPLLLSADRDRPRLPLVLEDTRRLLLVLLLLLLLNRPENIPNSSKLKETTQTDTHTKNLYTRNGRRIGWGRRRKT